MIMPSITFINSIRWLVQETLTTLDMISPDVVALIMRTGAAETLYRELEQKPKGPGIGFWQVESGPPDAVPLFTAEDTWFKFVTFRPDLQARIGVVCGFPQGPWTRLQIAGSIPLQITLARLKYWRCPFPIPSGIREQARYYVDKYNAGGAATVPKFLAACRELGL
jgi:hypothetical protein